MQFNKCDNADGNKRFYYTHIYILDTYSAQNQKTRHILRSYYRYTIFNF